MLYGDRILGRLVKRLIWVLGRTSPNRSSDLTGAIARRVGPWLPAHRIGQTNLRAAFPDKDAAGSSRRCGKPGTTGRVAGETFIWADWTTTRPSEQRTYPL